MHKYPRINSRNGYKTTPRKCRPRGLIDDEKPVKAVPSRALWLWGRLRDFEEENIFAASPDEIIEEMLDTMKPDAERLIPILRDWLGKSKFGGANGSENKAS